MFGKEIREKYFTLLNPKVNPINHGSYGLTPTPVFDTFVDSMKEDLQHPDKYMSETEPKEYLEGLMTIGEVINSDYRNLALIDNATTGINVIYRSMKWEKGDKVLVTSVVYDSCEHVLEYMAQMFGIELIKLNVDIEVPEQELVDSFENVFKTQDIKLVMFDLVSSMPAFLFPYKQLLELTKKYNVISVIDGAHGVGMFPIDFSTFKPDFFTSNLHKWYYVPRPCAILYVDPKFHGSIQPFPISHVFIDYEGENTLIKKFYFLASKNYAYYNCVKSAKGFREMIGGDEKIWEYCQDLKHKVTNYLIERWDTKALSQHQPLQMVNIVLPEKLAITQEQSMKLRDLSTKSHNYFQIGVYKQYSVMRLSFQVYNEFEDYVKAVEVLEPLIAQLKSKASL